ncbi:hypothetical protein L1987_78504 [Smallanthus sonchifolius]|uniref:Uncharacterized protein n=1 Tax=Smallanthus sonchifolius TaxID=185202 RepID=A0ACB8ZCK2_9ASTR|nr:hypothetical protein L1987_78504 [Smallanthus sonchifolius]
MSNTWIWPEYEPATSNWSLEPKQAESLKAMVVDSGSRVCELKIVTVAECMAAKSCEDVGKNASEVMDETKDSCSGAYE